MFLFDQETIFSRLNLIQSIEIREWDRVWQLVFLQFKKDIVSYPFGMIDLYLPRLDLEGLQININIISYQLSHYYYWNDVEI